MKVLFLVTCANKERIPQLWATLATLFAGLAKAPNNDFEVHVAYNDTDLDTFNAPNSDHAVTTWSVLFASVGIKFGVTCFDSKLSPPQMWMEIFAKCTEDAWFVNVDDDMLWMDPQELALYIQGMEPESADLFTFGFWDIENKRQYFDWYPQVHRSSLKELIDKHGERAIWNQRWTGTEPWFSIPCFSYHPSTVVCTGASVVPISKILANKELADRLKTWEKGKRGYDYYLCNKVGPKRFHFFKTYVNHIGVYRPQLDGKLWTGLESDESNHIQSNLPHDKI